MEKNYMRDTEREEVWISRTKATSKLIYNSRLIKRVSSNCLRKRRQTEYHIKSTHLFEAIQSLKYYTIDTQIFFPSNINFSCSYLELKLEASPTPSKPFPLEPMTRSVINFQKLIINKEL